MPGIPNNIDFTAFDTLTAAQMDDLIENDVALSDGTAITALSHSVTAIANPYKFRAYRNASLTLSTGAQKVTFDTENFDTNNNFDVTTNVGRYTIPISGFYQFSSTLQATTAAGYNYQIALYKNGSAVSYGGFFPIPGVSGVGITVMDFLQLTASDYIEVYAYTSNPGGQGIVTGSTISYFSGHLISRT